MLLILPALRFTLRHHVFALAAFLLANMDVADAKNDMPTSLNGIVLDRPLLGIGDRLIWSFEGAGGEGRYNVSTIDLITGGSGVDQVPEDLRKQLRLLSLEGLSRAAFVVMWVTPKWQPYWFPVHEVQRAIDIGITPVFVHWYFGDRLNGDHVRERVVASLDDYGHHTRRLGQYIGQLDGDVLISVEPEFNTAAIEDWPEFGSILRRHGIENLERAIHEENAFTGHVTRAKIGTTLVDTGSRDPDALDITFRNKALGDRRGWDRSIPLIEALEPSLDFLGFQQIVSPLHRHPQFPEQIVTHTAYELGLHVLAERMVNYSRYLNTRFDLPILIPFVGLPTSVWQDTDGDGEIDESEIELLGFEEEVGRAYRDIGAALPEFYENDVLGIGTMLLFDDPSHDVGGSSISCTTSTRWASLLRMRKLA